MVKGQLSGKDKAIIFDGDDTLWETQPLYDAAKEKFLFVLQQHGFTQSDIVALLDKIDTVQVSSMGFSRERFPSSMVRTYEHLCRTEGRTPRPELQERLFSIGHSVFQKTPNLYPDALETLYSLRQTHTLVLATKGDREVQSDRIKTLRLGPYFDRIYILERKTEEEYLMIAQELGIALSQICVIGNSVRSDINPAIRAGLRAVLIPRGEWEYEKSTIEGGSLFVVNSLADAVALIKRQERRGVDEGNT